MDTGPMKSWGSSCPPCWHPPPALREAQERKLVTPEAQGGDGAAGRAHPPPTATSDGSYFLGSSLTAVEMRTEIKARHELSGSVATTSSVCPAQSASHLGVSDPPQNPLGPSTPFPLQLFVLARGNDLPCPHRFPGMKGVCGGGVRPGGGKLQVPEDVALPGDLQPHCRVVCHQGTLPALCISVSGSGGKKGGREISRKRSQCRKVPPASRERAPRGPGPSRPAGVG